MSAKAFRVACTGGLLALTGCVVPSSRQEAPVRFVDTGVQTAAAAPSRRAADSTRSTALAEAPAQVDPPRLEFIQPKPDPGNGLPIYPASLLARHVPPTVVKVRLRIETDGAVFKVDPLEQPVTADQRAFIDAVRDACWSWKYSPLIRIDLSRGSTYQIATDGSSTEFKGHPTALPFHVDYAFTFSRRDGRPGVETEMIASASDAFDGAPGGGQGG
ncbi:MAG: hypothetical protein ABI843_03725 [Dokdonella sp.]